METDSGRGDAAPAAARGGVPQHRTVALTVGYAASAAICCLLAATGKAQFTDVHVYRLGGEAVLHGAGLYGVRYAGLPFTYPPFAAAAFTGLAALPWAAAVALITFGSVAAVPVMLYLALRLPSGLSFPATAAAWRLALAAAAAAIWLEPVRSTLGYGQIDLLLAAAVLYDLHLPDAAWRKGAVIGVAAGIKLVPAIFIVYLLITRRFRAAATAAAVLAATVAAGFAIAPASSAHYWNITFLKPGHVSPVQNAENQSLLGALSRTLHSANIVPLWLPLAIAVALAGLALAARAQRAGDEALGFSLCAVTGLLVSPISWTHHWVIAVPALLWAAVAVARHPVSRRSAAVRVLGAAGILAVAAIGWSHIARDVPGSGWLRLPAAGVARSEVYVVAGLAALILAAIPVLAKALSRPRLSAPDPPGSSRSPEPALGWDRGSPRR